MFYSVIKRAFDILASGIALLVFIPVWLITAIGIELSDPGPVFYLANRVGKDNRVFRMFKFRSMRVDKDANEKSFKADTSRIFPFGKFIRATKIDELPQLLNVFIGDMSVIGPRPDSVDQAEIMRAGENAVIANLVPGMSGPSALYDSIYGETIEDEEAYKTLVLPTRMKLNVYYCKVQSFGYDLKMIWYTLVCIFYALIRKQPEWILKELVSCVETKDGEMK